MLLSMYNDTIDMSLICYNITQKLSFFSCL